MFKKVGIITNPEIEEVGLIKKMVGRLSKSGVDIFCDPSTANKIKNLGVVGVEIKDMDCNLVVVLGGDGTILWSVKELSHDPLLFCINTGRFGFLAELDVKDASDEDVLSALDSIFNNKFRVDERVKLKVDGRYEALNDVGIFPVVPATLLEFKIKIRFEDGVEEIPNFRADGILVSTQTGSTAHSLSAGGSIIHPKTNAFIITPSNPFMSKQKPLVVPDNVEITITLERKRRDVYLICDGIAVKELHPLDKVSVKKSDGVVRFVRLH